MNAPFFSQPHWGIGVVFRNTNIPYNTHLEASDDERTTSFIPLFYYQGKHFYLDGTEFGFRMHFTSALSTAVFTRLRMADVPEVDQNHCQRDAYDPGIQVRYDISKTAHADMEIMCDRDGKGYANLSYKETFYGNDFDITPFATVTYKTSGFNTKYYGFDMQHLNGGYDLATGADVWYHLVSNLYLYGKAQIKLLDSAVTKSRFVSANAQDEYWLGFAFMDRKQHTQRMHLKSKPYLRLAYGFATRADLGEIVTGGTVTDPHHNHMFSLFYGYPVSDTLFSLPMPVYITPGVVWHQSSDVQENIYECVLAFKTYYTLPLPWRIRFGIAEGISYSSKITYIESSDIPNDEQSSKLLNHLGFSVDFNLADIFGKKLEGLWLGYDIHHRSAVFKSASQFGRFKGGSNYNTVYLQYHF